jgi:transcriptional regulator with XRE-family HTH domain
MNDQAVGQRAEFGVTVAGLRQERGWSQDELGAQLAEKAHRELRRRDVRPPTRQTVSRWELGLRFPDPLNGYLLCRVFEKDPEDLCLHQVVTPQVTARYGERQSQVGHALAAIADARGRAADPADLDWERVGFILRAMRRVDPLTVEDQWALTLRILGDRRHMRAPSFLDQVVEHAVRLRQLRTQTTDDRLYRELTIMLGQMLIAAGSTWTGLTDFGLAVHAYRGAAALGEELREEWLRTTALISQAQLSGIHAIAPWTPAARMALMEETQGAVVGASPQARVWIHATRAQIHALLGRQVEAQRALELAARAQALVAPGSGFYFGMIDPVYLPIQEGSVTLLAGRPREAADLFRRVLGMVDRDEMRVRTWATVYLAGSEAAAGDFEHAAPTLSEARRLAREIDCPLLEHSVARIAARDHWATDQSPSTRLRHQLDTNI